MALIGVPILPRAVLLESQPDAPAGRPAGLPTGVGQHHGQSRDCRPAITTYPPTRDGAMLCTTWG